MYRAVLDTCALVPGLQRDFLLQLAAEETYAPLWGSGILFELDYVLAGLDAKRGRADNAERRRHLFERMRHAFPGAEVHAPKNRVYDYGLDDPSDGHVAHAAIVGKADVIVTDDIRAGFRAAAALREAAVDVVHPAEFAANTVSGYPEAGLRALTAMAERMTTPPRSPARGAGRAPDPVRDGCGRRDPGTAAPRRLTDRCRGACCRDHRPRSRLVVFVSASRGRM